jgi:hypothetical protein
MTWISAASNPNISTPAGTFSTQLMDARPLVFFETVTDIGDIQAALNNPLTAVFIKTMASGRPVDSGGSVRPASGLAYPRKV